MLRVTGNYDYDLGGQEYNVYREERERERERERGTFYNGITAKKKKKGK